MKAFKRFTALVLALVMAAMLAVSAYAATVVVKYKVYVYTSQLTFKQYDYSSSTTPSTRNLTILADSGLGSGSALYHVKYVNGALAYCIQPGVRSDDSSNYVQGSSGCWYNLPASVQSGIALALACGYPSAEYGTAYGDSNSSDIIGAEKWAATQAVIWDLICEYRSPYDYRSWGSSPFYNCVDTSRYPTFALWYDMITAAMQSATDIPSFAATSSRWCDTIELTKDTSGNYSASVTDTNGVLSDFNFASNSGNGITFTQRGNTLTITATPEAAKSLSTEKTYSATGSAYGIDPDEAVLCWYDSTGKYQSLASYTGTGLDPVRAYIKIKATVTEDKGSLTINKTDADTGKALAGVTYRLFDSAGNKIADVTTGTDGKAVFSDLPLGSYTYQEISAPSGYVVDNTKYPITITSTTLNITATRTNALGKASVEISKVDADSNTPLQNAGFRLYDASGSQVAEGYTDANGKLTFTGLKLGSYTCKEFQAPAGYELDETAFPVTLNQNGQVLKVTRENKLITGSIEILKVDADTKQPLAGVVYRLFDADGNKIADGTTDANGKVTFDNLKPGSYAVASCDIRRFFYQIWECSRRMKNVVLENKNFETIIRDNNDPKTMLYCDPPYYLAEKCYEVGFAHEDHQRLHDVLVEHKGYFMVSYNCCEYIKELYKDCYIFHLTRHNSQSRQKDNDYEEYIITNYDVCTASQQTSMYPDFGKGERLCKLIHTPEHPLKAE